MIKSKILRDAALLTIMQLFLDSAALFLNTFITRQMGASAIGILSLMGSFLGLASILSNGNAFLCTSRLISEEIGRKNGDPNGILFYGFRLCLLLSAGVSAAMIIFAEPISQRFFSGAQMTTALRLMPLALITGAFAACLKGYFNATRRAAVAAVVDIAEFVTRCGYIVAAALLTDVRSEHKVCGIMIGGVIAGNTVSVAILGLAYLHFRSRSCGVCSISFRQYTLFSLPIMGGSILTAVLSSTNDALIPICLRLYGDSAGQALGQFGLFEAIVIPTLFFPSVVLCSVAGMIVSETARANAARNTERIRSLTDRIRRYTLVFSFYAAAVIMRFGKQIGELLGGGELTGRMIKMIAPVIPFIYMEIVLEAMIKGLGQQKFSSANYLAEYAIRIAAVLIFIPRFGFCGIVISYYASNIFGNIMRYIKTVRTAGAGYAIFLTVIMPIAVLYASMKASELVIRFTGITACNTFGIAIYVVVWGLFYFISYFALGKVKLISKCGEGLFVNNAQQTTHRVL
ncbi:polysaccharide biosynthesis C-terminal domain-containing protein [Ruminococcus flavefaciens]|uniref:polysaccharide biosynthesis C-terminal domain-containing protein n=1 Tax=Ruminococcus flavefaciens TaxID=1265 RepID=UPI00037FAF4E|nr:polysaccharide biosynthesis C-terminal domain-containing protein [Ruminococcus flavefaciens]